MEPGDRQVGVQASWAALGPLDSSSNPPRIKSCWLSLVNVPERHVYQLVSASKALVQSSSQSPGHGPSLRTGTLYNPFPTYQPDYPFKNTDPI